MKNESIIIPLIGLTPHGGNRIILQLASKLQNYYKVKIITPYIADDLPFSVDKNINIENLKYNINNKVIRSVVFVILFPFLFKNRNKNIYLINHFLTIIPGLLLKYIFREKVLFLVQGLEYKAFKNIIIKYIVKNLTKFGFKYIDTIVVNKQLNQELESEFNLKSSYCIQLGVDNLFLTNKIMTEKKYDIIYFLRKEYYKGLTYFDEFLEISNNKIVCITQDQDLFNKYKDKKNVVVLKPSSDIELIKIMDQSKVCLYTSIYEGFGLPPLECMARGVPSVLFDSGGINNYCINGYNSFIIEHSDVCSMSDKVDLLLNDNAIYDKFSKNAILTAKRNNIDNYIEDCCQFILTRYPY